MSGPHRLSAGGSRVDRGARLRFTFDGKAYWGHPGDTLASALMAEGVRVFGRSFKYHRPRGLLGAGAEEPNALVEIGEGARREPNIRATQAELYEGLIAQSQNRWPSLKFDVGAVNSRLSRLFPAGFYYKTFMWPRAAWIRLYEPMIRHAAGLGRAAESEAGRDPDAYEHMHWFADVAVIGGGPAGLAAALAAGEAGARVVLIDETPTLGGRLDVDGGEIDGRAAEAWGEAAAARLRAMPNVLTLTRTTATGLYDYGYLWACERLGDHTPPGEAALRHRLWRIRARETVIAAGAIERPLVFANNDLPGVMLASAARSYVARYGVAPGKRALIATNNDDGYRTALALSRAGVTVMGIVDARADPQGPLVTAARERGLQIEPGAAVAKAEGAMGVEGAHVATLRASGRAGAGGHVDCDLIAMSGGWNPALHLHCHPGGAVAWRDDIAAFAPGAAAAHVRVAGAAKGAFDLADCLREGHEAGLAAARDAGAEGAVAAPPEAARLGEGPMRPLWFTAAPGKAGLGTKHFLDFQNDVTAADVELAAREGYQSVEHAKRFTTLGMATDQGKTSNVNGLAILADALDKKIPEVGVTTFRPPYTPLSFGAIAGTNVGARFQPVRATAIYDWHAENGADWEPVGQWRRPYCYPRAGESRRDAVNREIMTVRGEVGLLDASTLGKIVVQGPDAGRFLDLVYTNVMSSLKLGQCRYGLMCNESGFLFDDGVVARLSEDAFLCHTTSGGAERVHAWFEEWLQTEWFDLQVFTTNVTEQWSQIAVVGPEARATIASLTGDVDLSAEALPFMRLVEGRLEGAPVRVFRISFSGELSYEIATPAAYGRHLWDALMAEARARGGGAYGTEALHVMRAEKGYVAIGDETDGTVTPHDLGLSWAVSKKKADFIGRRGLMTADLTRKGRKQLVGLLTEDPEFVLPDGAHAVSELRPDPPMPMIGHVTSTYWSPTLGRSIAMALIQDGRARMGEMLDFPLEHQTVRATVCDPVFYDKEGARQNV